jgi:hypothetical protein
MSATLPETVACRRCGRHNPSDAATCHYCELPSPATGPTGVGADGRSRNPLVVFRWYFASAAFVIVGVISYGVLKVTSNGPSAPACDDPRITSNVAEIVHENAVYELTPAVAARFPVTTFAGLTKFDPNGDATANRKCRGVMTMVLDSAATGAVARLVAKPPASAPAVGALIAKSWHASTLQLELPIAYSISKAGEGAGWEMNLDATAMSAIRDVIRVVASGAK